jgi:hypothetical protein
MRIRFAILSLGLPAALAGCAVSTTTTQSLSAGSSTGTTSAAVSGPTAIQGVVEDGTTPIAGAHVYLMKANGSAYGTASVSLLSASSTGYSDSVGAYVLTDSNGNYAIPGTYTCSSQDQVYLYALGGNAGHGPNPAIGLLAAIGNCPAAETPSPEKFNINEITTVGTAYAIAGFASDAAHVAFSGTPLALVDIQNAFANAPNLYTTAGASLSTTPAGNGSVPNELIDTLANTIASCPRSSGAFSACDALFAIALSSAGTMPTDTATAMLNIAHNPGNNVATLFGLATGNTPFSPSLPAPPNDFTIGINYTGGGLNSPYAIAIDGEGNAWIANLGNSTITKLAPTGATLTTSAGNNNGNPIGPVGVAIDLSGNAWIVNAVSSSLTKYAASGALLSPASGYFGGGLAVPQAIASDSLGNIWVANYLNSVSKFSNGGTPISPANGYTGGGVGGPVAIAIDPSGDVWIANSNSVPSSVTKLSGVGAAMSPASGYIGGGLDNPFSIAIDSGGDAWVANYSNNSVSKLSSSGTPISPDSGFTGAGLSLPFAIAVDGAGNAWVANSGANSISELSNEGSVLSPGGFTGGLLNGPQAVAPDGSGNIWVANGNDISVTQLIGVSVPVVTPLVTGIKNNQLGTRP